MRLQAAASRATTLLARNPVLFCKVLLAKIGTARPMPPLPVRKRIGDVVFECDLADYHAAAAMYFGSYSLLVIEAMREILRSGDTFIDVGANIGYLTAVAASLVGPNGAVHSFEPVPAYFARLKRLAELNPGFSITAVSCAVGDAAGTSTIYVTHEPGQSTLVSGYKSPSQIRSKLEVPTVRLDSYIESRVADPPALIKIDVEGFELAVLQGLEAYFKKSDHRPPIICEIAPRACSLCGRSISDLAEFMAGYGYSARDLADGETPVELSTITHVEDVLFLASNS